MMSFIVMMSCSTEPEPEDCAGVVGGASVLSGCDNLCNSTAVADCAGTCDGTDYGSQCMDGSYACNVDDCPAPTAEVIVGTFTLISVIVHGADCSDDDGSLGVCFPDNFTSQSDCVETGTGDCWDENNNGIEGIVEADCARPNRWINFGWNLWAAVFPELSYTFSDDGTYTGGGNESGTWTLDGAILTATDSSSGEVIIATVSGNTFTAEVFDTFTSDSVDCAEMTFTK